MSDTWRPRRDGPWVAVDCGLFRHRKVEGLSAQAFRLLIALWCHCGDELTDGHVSTRAMRRLRVEARSPASALQELYDAGLLEGHGPWEVPGYLDWNPPRAHVEARRAATRDRVARHRAHKRTGNGPGNGVTNAVSNTTDVQKYVRERVGSTGPPPGSQSRPGATTRPERTTGQPDTLDTMQLAASAHELLARLRAQQGTGEAHSATHEHDGQAGTEPGPDAA